MYLWVYKLYKKHLGFIQLTYSKNKGKLYLYEHKLLRT